MARPASRLVVPLLAAALAACGGGSKDTTADPADACSHVESPLATVTGQALVLPAAQADLGGLTLQSFQVQLVYPEAFFALGYALATAGSPAAIDGAGAWSATGVRPASVGLGVLAAALEPGVATDFVPLTGVVTCIPAGQSTAQATSAAYAVPRAFLERLWQAVRAPSTAPLGEGFVLVVVPPDVQPGGPAGLTVIASAPGYLVQYPDDAFAGTQASLAAHGVAVVRRGTATTVGQLEFTLGNTSTPRCATGTSTGCYVPSLGSPLPQAAFFAPMRKR